MGNFYCATPSSLSTTIETTVEKENFTNLKGILASHKRKRSFANFEDQTVTKCTKLDDESICDASPVSAADATEELSYDVLLRRVHDSLLDKYNALIFPDASIHIPVAQLRFKGWPEQVRSKYFFDWSIDDLVIINSHLDTIQLELVSAHQRLLCEAPPSPCSEPILKYYSMIGIIGRGGFGEVRCGQRLDDNLPVAIKVISKNRLDNNVYYMVIREVHIMSTLNHPGIIKLVDFFEDADYFYIVTELFGCSWAEEKHQSFPSNSLNEETAVASEYLGTYDLFQFLDGLSVRGRTLSEALIRDIFTQIYEAVIYLFNNRICHCDLKPQNILIDRNHRVKLIDFGLAKIVEVNDFNEEAHTIGFSGTMISAAPEIIWGLPYLRSQTEAWSLGVILYFLLTTIKPFDTVYDIYMRRFCFPEEDTLGKKTIPASLV